MLLREISAFTDLELFPICNDFLEQAVYNIAYWTLKYYFQKKNLVEKKLSSSGSYSSIENKRTRRDP